MDVPEGQNPIVAMAQRIRARRDIEGAIESATPAGAGQAGADVLQRLDEFGKALQIGAKRLNSILGKSGPGVTFVRLERPLRLRVRFREKRIGLDADEIRQLVLVTGEGLEGEYQFDTGAATPALINLSKLSTEEGYGDALTPSLVLKAIAREAELPRPAHLDDPPLRY